jgi:hypothetical protein
MLREIRVLGTRGRCEAVTVDLALGANPEWKRAASYRPIRSWPPWSTLRSVPTVALPFARVNMDDTTIGGGAGSVGGAIEKTEHGSAAVGVRAESKAGRT